MDAAATTVCPYVGSLAPAVRDALTRHAPGRVTIRIDPDDMACYWQVLATWWARRGGLLVVEHDIVIHTDVVPSLTGCGSPWCVYPYAGPGGVLLTESLGCTRFAAALQDAEPDLLTWVGGVGDDGLPAKDWRRLDVRIARALRARGYTPHHHTPPVTHLHEYPREG